MAGYKSRVELKETQQSLLKEYEHQPNKEIKDNAAILSYLSQLEQVKEQVPCQEIQQALERETECI